MMFFAPFSLDVSLQIAGAPLFLPNRHPAYSFESAKGGIKLPKTTPFFGTG
jgi:hypothetical protein